MTDEFLDELISGFLDGELEPQELRQLEEILQRDPEAARRLKLLQSARVALSRPTEHHLPDSFAQRVLEAARVEAQRLGLPDSHPIRLGESGDKGHRNTSIPSAPSAVVLPEVSYPAPASASGRYWQSIGFGVAASLLIGAGSFWLISRSFDSGPNPLPLAGNGSSLNGKATQDKVSDPQIVPSNTNNLKPDTQIVQNSGEPKTIESSSDSKKPMIASEDSSPSASKSPVANVASADTATNKPEPPANNSKNPTAPAIESQEMKSLASAAGGVESLNLLMVVDLELSAQAWNDRAFSKIINEFGIAYEKPLVADNALVEQLGASSLVTVETPDTKVDTESGEVYFVFVQARAARLDSAINEMYQRADEFPDVYFDLAMDAPCQDVLKRLETGSKFEDDSEDIFGIATPVAKSADGLKGFASHAPRGKRVSPEQRQQAKSGNAGSISLNPVSQVLFVLRRPSGAEGRP
ncbi:MAG: hypothetical protein RLY14_2071 [Planctomycetota bacterium]